MKKVHPYPFQVTQNSEQGNTTLSHCGVAPAAGAEALPKPPGALLIICNRFFDHYHVRF